MTFMSTTSSSARPLAAAARRRSEANAQELPDYCARPMCRSPFTRVVGPGRPQAFCSEVCRRAAEKELRQAKSLLAHFEDLTAQLRIDIAAFGRGGLSQATETAEMAFVGDSDDPLAQELRALHAAVSPVIVDDTG